MHRLLNRILWILVLVPFLFGCDSADTDDRPVDEPIIDDAVTDGADDIEYRWLPSNDAEKLKALEDQLGGFSQAMMEVGYRYNELYWAGTDRNWDYADYQLEKLVATMELGFERRPARRASGQPFLNEDVPAVQQAIESEDGELFDEQIQALTQSCNTCHAEEAVPFIVVQPRADRLSPVAPLRDSD